MSTSWIVLKRQSRVYTAWGLFLERRLLVSHSGAISQWRSKVAQSDRDLWIVQLIVYLDQLKPATNQEILRHHGLAIFIEVGYVLCSASNKIDSIPIGVYQHLTYSKTPGGQMSSCNSPGTDARESF